MHATHNHTRNVHAAHTYTHITVLVMLSFLILRHLVKIYIKAFISIKLFVQILVFTTKQLKNRN